MALVNRSTRSSDLRNRHGGAGCESAGLARFAVVSGTQRASPAAHSVLTGEPRFRRRLTWFATKVPMSVSPERRKSKKSTREYLHVWQTLKRTRYSSIPLGVISENSNVQKTKGHW